MFQCVSTSLYITVTMSGEILQHRSVVRQICLSAWLSVLLKQTTHPDEQFNILSHRCHIKNVLFCEILRRTRCMKKSQQLPILVSLHKKLISTFHHFVVLCRVDVDMLHFKEHSFRDIVHTMIFLRDSSKASCRGFYSLYVSLFVSCLFVSVKDLYYIYIFHIHALLKLCRYFVCLMPCLQICKGTWQPSYIIHCMSDISL